MKKMIQIIILLLSFLSISFAENKMTKKQGPKAIKSAYNLNVIYFLGSDMKPVENYKKRLSELLLYTQDFYRKEMYRNGFGNRTFGLKMKSKKIVDILEYKAINPANFYPYDNGGGWKAMQELQKYFKENSSLVSSQHFLIIMPHTSGDEFNPGGVPFYGMGKYCFALDYSHFDLKHVGKNTREGNLLTKWFGGMAHELGHGLNLPHNAAQKSDIDKFGTPLMGAGNYTFGMKPTYLTPASCALLGASELFSPEKKDFYQGGNKVDISYLSVKFVDRKIEVKCNYDCEFAIKNINFYIDNADYGHVNNDYDAVSFSIKQGSKKKGKFSYSINLDELTNENEPKFQLRIRFILENGNWFSKNLEFNRDDLKNVEERNDVKKYEKK